MSDPEGRWRDGKDKTDDDHEKRIRDLEKWQSWILGATFGLGIAAGVLGRYVWAIVTGP